MRDGGVRTIFSVVYLYCILSIMVLCKSEQLGIIATLLNPLKFVTFLFAFLPEACSSFTRARCIGMYNFRLLSNSPGSFQIQDCSGAKQLTLLN